MYISKMSYYMYCVCLVLYHNPSAFYIPVCGKMNEQFMGLGIEVGLVYEYIVALEQMTHKRVRVCWNGRKATLFHRIYSCVLVEDVTEIKNM